MTREELDAMDVQKLDDALRDGASLLIVKGQRGGKELIRLAESLSGLIAQARRAIGLETCQCGRELSHVCMICDNDD